MNPVQSFFFFSKRCSSQDLRMRTADPCDRATLRETRKAAPSAPPIRPRVITTRPHHLCATVAGDLATAPTPQANHANISPSFSRYQQPLDPRFSNPSEFFSLFILFFLIGGNLG